MKKRKLKTVLKQANEKTLEKLAEHTITDEATKKRIHKAVMKNIALSAPQRDVDTQTYHITETRHNSWMQYASIVACIVVIGGTTGVGCYLKNNAPQTQPIQTATEITAEEIQPQPEEIPSEIENDIPVETIFVPQAPIEYDLTTKEGIYGKMLNSVDYFDKAFVVVIEMETAEENLITVMNLWADVTTGQSLEYVKRDDIMEENGIPDLIALNRPPLVEEDEYYGHFTDYCDGSSVYAINPDEKTYRLSSCSPISRRDDSPIDAEAVRQWFLETHQQENDEQQNYVRFEETEEVIFRHDATSSRVGAKWLQPYSFAMYALSDFDKWELGGKVGYIGRECIEIAGDAYGYNWYPEGSTFTAYIDEETGCLLRNVVYDADGNLVDWQVTMAISFDEEAEIEFPNLDEYTEIKDEPIDMEEYYAYKTNSKGETYGIGGQYAFTWENYDLLPDLILFDYDKRNDVGYYQRKDEIFGMFPEDPERHNYRQEFNKLEGDIPIEVNMYDCEGNFAYTITYYHEP